MKWFVSFLLNFLIFLKIDAIEKKKIVCYYQIGSHSRHLDGNFQVENIDPNLCTHLVYAYFGIDANNDQFVSKEPGFDLNVEENGRGNIKKFNELKHENPNLKTIAAVGGWDNEPSLRWSNMASNSHKRNIFIKSAIKFVRKYKFDGVLLYWCFPGVNGDPSVDKDNFATLVQEFKEQFNELNLIIGVAAHAVKETTDISYDIKKISYFADFVYLTGFDLYGDWLPYSGIHTALYAGKNSHYKDRTVNEAVSYWIDQGASPEKLVLGVAIFGRTFTLKDKTQILPGFMHAGKGRPGKHTTEAGLMGYNEFCAIQFDEKWKMEWDDEQKVPYAYLDDQWIGYENIESVKIKAMYVNELQLGGIGASFIEDDDFKGICGESYPLLKTIKSIIQTADVDYIINLSIFKKSLKFKNTQLVYHSSETLNLNNDL